MCNDTVNCIINENLCGYIDIKDCFYHTIWQLLGAHASITVIIKNMSKKTIKLLIESNTYKTIRIYPNDEKSITIPHVKKIAVRCKDANETDNCSGSYQLIVHYFFDCKETKKPKYNKCEHSGWSTIDNRHFS